MPLRGDWLRLTKCVHIYPCHWRTVVRLPIPFALDWAHRKGRMEKWQQSRFHLDKDMNQRNRDKSILLWRKSMLLPSHTLSVKAITLVSWETFQSLTRTHRSKFLVTRIWPIYPLKARTIYTGCIILR